ncbi:hypothetical protein PLICRDRAFT_657751 [Plicaturopsis crispa FD-325 SS-3]|nr:hypothetical protein PLICRDRAFT_657751 [Plicaturopsis crispa FD-325 SS-3]
MANYTVQELALVEAPYLFGPLVNWALLGCLSLQVYTYSVSGSRDARPLKALVYGIYLLDVAQTAIATYCAWVQLILGPRGFGDVDDFIWPISVLVLFVGLASFVVQCFFAWRIWVLKNTPLMHKVVICIFVLAFVQFSGSVASASLTFIATKLQASQVPIVGGSLAPGALPAHSSAVSRAQIWLAAGFLCVTARVRKRKPEVGNERESSETWRRARERTEREKRGESKK